jgi:hypothetical protein
MKKNNYKTMFLPIMMLLLVVTFVLVGCNPEPEPGSSAGGDTPTSDTLSPNTPSQNVNVSDFLVSSCLDEDRRGYYDSDTIYVTAINDNSLKIRTTNTHFNCCSEEFWEDVTVDGNNITVSMYEDAEVPCDCVCPRSVVFALNNMEFGKTYNIFLLKSDDYVYYKFELVFDEGIDLMFIR